MNLQDRLDIYTLMLFERLEQNPAVGFCSQLDWIYMHEEYGLGPWLEFNKLLLFPELLEHCPESNKMIPCRWHWYDCENNEIRISILKMTIEACEKKLSDLK